MTDRKIIPALLALIALCATLAGCALTPEGTQADVDAGIRVLDGFRPVSNE